MLSAGNSDVGAIEEIFEFAISQRTFESSLVLPGRRPRNVPAQNEFLYGDPPSETALLCNYTSTLSSSSTNECGKSGATGQSTFAGKTF